MNKLNLIVVDKCTNYCRYCFASNEMAKTKAISSLAKEGILTVRDFVARSGPGFKINLLGGEPLLYSHLPELVSTLLELDNVAHVCIFTGGIASVHSMQRLLDVCDARVEFLFNINERADYKSQVEYDLVLKNISQAQSNGIRAGLGYNIYKLGFDGSEILNICVKYGVDTLRWTVAYPELLPSTHTTTLPPSQYEKAAIEVFEFLEAAYRVGIKAGLDCPLPKCFFSSEQLARLALTQPLTVQGVRACGPVVDVSPDLEVFRCFALSDLKRKKLTDFKQFSDIVHFYNMEIDERLGVPSVFPFCAQCEFGADRSCYGGCIAHSPDALDMRVSNSNLIERLFHAVSHGQFQEAISNYNKHRAVLSKRPLAEFVISKAFASIGDNHRAIKHARRAVNIQSGSKPAVEFVEHLCALLHAESNGKK